MEREGAEYVFGLPGEETLDLMDSLSRSRLKFVLTRHESGAAFMAGAYGRLTGKPGVCLATLGPGATNLITGIADALLDRAPLVAITGQVALDRIHKEFHQYIDIVEVLRPVTKWNARVEIAEVIPEMVGKAFKIAAAEKPGATHLELPENIGAMQTTGEPLSLMEPEYPRPNLESVRRAAELICSARRPIVLAGNGVARRRASPELRAFAHKTNIPVANTFMGKGVLDYLDPLSALTVGLRSCDLNNCGLDEADVVIAVGYDLVEYSPSFWNPDRSKKIVHVDTRPSEVDDHYMPEVEIVSELKDSLEALAIACDRSAAEYGSKTRDLVLHELAAHRDDAGFPPKPQKLLADLREVLDGTDILVSDVGAHKLWIAWMYPAREPNTVLISNGFASMGVGLPGALAAKLVYPERKVVAVCGDGSFLMSAAELETAKRLGTAFVTVVWVDGGLGLIELKQHKRFGREFGVCFGNPDLAGYARSFGLPGFRIESAEEFLPTLKKALALSEPAVIEVPVDYSGTSLLLESIRPAGE
jgi:acetolactate synthase I/II/III large subunit